MFVRLPQLEYWLQRKGRGWARRKSGHHSLCLERKGRLFVSMSNRPTPHKSVLEQKALFGPPRDKGYFLSFLLNLLLISHFFLFIYLFIPSIFSTPNISGLLGLIPTKLFGWVSKFAHLSHFLYQNVGKFFAQDLTSQNFDMPKFWHQSKQAIHLLHKRIHLDNL